MVRSTFSLAALLLGACAGGASTADTSAANGPAPAAGAAAAATTAAPTDGRALVRQMHGRYAGKWYRTLTFTQKTTFTGPEGQTREETWYEAGSIPGKLRIDVAPLDSMNAFMFVGDSAFVFRGGKRVNARADRNELMTLGFDVYGQSPDTTEAQLTGLGFDLGTISEGTWQGKPVWIVGAAAGDTTANQFWIEKDRLLFVRLLKNEQNPQGAVRLDVTFDRYEPLGQGWIAPLVLINVNGRPYMREEYSDVRADTPLDASLYDTRSYQKPGWVGAAN